MLDLNRSLTAAGTLLLITLASIFFAAAPSATPVPQGSSSPGAAPGGVLRDQSRGPSVVASRAPQGTHRVTGEAPASIAPITLTDSDGQELTLEDLSVRTAIHGMLSLTELEFRFRNPKPQRIEGRFSCTLPQNAAISRFAKEVGGQLMEGEVVERLRANQVYEQFLHRMRDPALLEQDQGNRFSARIFPIEANASLRIVLSYSALLPMRGGVRSYSLPLRGMPKVNHLTFRAFVTPLPGEETTVDSKSTIDGLSGATRSSAEVFTIDKSDYTPERDIQLSWRPTVAAAASRIIRAGDFYLASFRPRVEAAAKQTTISHDWLFYVDTSASSAEGAVHRIHALQELLAALPAEDHVQLRAFDQDIATLTIGSAADVAKNAGSLLRNRLFLGGTDLRALFSDVSRAARERRSRAIVIASDFVPTLGTTDRNELTTAIRAIPDGTTIDALILGPREESAIAKAVTRGRGRVVRVAFSESIDAQARNATAELRRPVGASFEVSDSGAEWVYPARVDDVQSGDEVVVLGKVKAGADPNTALLPGSYAPPVVQRLTESAFATLLEREAYRAYLDYLGEREANEPSDAVRRALATEQVKVSVEQRVVIPRTTMLVLESEWDYQRFGLDRRALAAILTIDAGGISRVDRQVPKIVPMPVAVARDRVVPVPLQNAIQSGGASTGVPLEMPSRADAVTASELEGAAKASRAEAITGTASAPAVGVAGGVVGGVIGGVVGGSVATNEPLNARARRVAPPPAPERKRSDANWAKVERPDAARVAQLQAAIKRDPTDRELYNQLSEALAARNEWRELRAVALQWQEYDPENPQVYEVLAAADEQLGDAAEAARADASLIEVAPAKPELLQRAGLLLLRARRASLAEAPLRRALELRPDRVNSYRHLALMLWLDGRVEEAARVLESGTRQNFPQWYGNAQRVIREELAYVYRDWMARAPAQRGAIAERAREYNVDIDRRDTLRVTLAWETDANDVDLHVIDPEGDECYYGHKSNRSGIELYEDITQGLGPEVIRGEGVKRGKYDIGVRYFAAGPMGVSRGIVVVMRDDGQRQPNVEIHPFRLVAGGGDIRYVASVSVK